MEGLEGKSTIPADVMVRRLSTDSQDETFG